MSRWLSEDFPVLPTFAFGTFETIQVHDENQPCASTSDRLEPVGSEPPLG